MAQTRQSRPDYGLGFLVKFLKRVQVVLFSIGSGAEKGMEKVQCRESDSEPLWSELRTNEPVKAIIWPSLEYFSVRKSSNPWKLLPPRSPAQAQWWGSTDES